MRLRRSGDSVARGWNEQLAVAAAGDAVAELRAALPSVRQDAGARAGATLGRKTIDLGSARASFSMMLPEISTRSDSLPRCRRG